MIRRLLLLGVLLMPLQASAIINSALCQNSNDGHETATVPYGTRDANKCLLVDPGNGDPVIPFQYTYLNRAWVAPGDCSTFDFKVGSGAGATDPDKAILMDHVTWDGYSNSRGGTQAEDNPDVTCIEHDPIFTGKSDHKYSFQYWLLKNVLITNYVDCGQASTFGPPSNRTLFTCDHDAGEHADAIQFQGQPTDNGYLVLQDSAFINAIHSVREQANPISTVIGSSAYQNVQIGAVQASGVADHWITDCLDAHGSQADHLCTSPDWKLDGPQKPERWMVNVFGSSTTSYSDTPPIKTIIVNQNCGPLGCNQGSITYHNGWPHPYDFGGAGPPNLHANECANRQIANNHGNIYCYTSIEAAVADGHKLFPFAKLSCSGWATPPAECGGGGVPPALGLVTTVTTPVITGSAHTITAIPSGGTTPYSVTFDCDGNGSFESGPDTTSPFTQVCPAFVTPGSRTISAKVDDASAVPVVTDSAVVDVQDPIVCGDGVIDIGETCDKGGVAGALENLNGLTCQSPQFAYTGGALHCNATCDGYSTASCTGPPTIVRGDGQCVGPGETPENDYPDCEQTIVSYIRDNAVSGWGYGSFPLIDGIIIDRTLAQDQAINFIAEPILGASSAYRFIFDGSDNPPSQLQNSELYSMCGDTGSDITTALPCPLTAGGLTRGSHTLAVTGCSANFSGTFNVPPYTDARCTGNGGELGKTQTFTFHVVLREVVRNFIRDSIRHGMGRALLLAASEAR